jgi:hypothetical protein
MTSRVGLGHNRDMGPRGLLCIFGERFIPAVLSFLAPLALAQPIGHAPSQTGQGLLSADRRKTVCSITINSDDELKVFKNKMDPSNFRFVELVADSNDPSWLSRACQKMNQEIKAGRSGCDVLIVSGHFGGVFFGESNASLDIDELDKHACARSCDAILKQPKEVFLMGCNTLANKDRDKRGDDEYLKILVADGVPRDFAERVVAYRYGDVGYSLQQRMSAIFSSSARIYGFSSTGPVGAKAAPSLQKYLSKKSNYAAHLDGLEGEKNLSLEQSFAGTSFRQTQGSNDFAQSYYGESCGLMGPDPLAKVKAVDDLIASGKFFAHADKAVASILEAQRLSQGQVPDAKTLSKWRSNKAFMKQLRSTQEASPSLHEIRSDLRFMQDLIESGPSSPQMLGNQRALLRQVLSKPLNFISKDQVCAIAKKHPDVSLSSEMLPAQKSWNSFTLEAIGCFAQIDLDLTERLVNFALNKPAGQPAWLVEAAKRFLAKRNELPSASQEKIFNAALSEKDRSKRSELLRALASLENPPNWGALVGALGGTLGSSEKDALASALAERLKHPRGDARAWSANYVDPLLRSTDPLQQELGLRALQKAHIAGAESLLGGAFLSPSSWVKPQNAVLYAQVLRGLDYTSAQREALADQLDKLFPGTGVGAAVLDPVRDSHLAKDVSGPSAGQVWEDLKSRVASITPRECLESSFRLGSGKSADDARWWCLEQATLKPQQNECFAIAAEIRGASRSGAYWSCLKNSQAKLSPEACDNAAQGVADARQGDDLRWNCLESLKSLKLLDEASCLRLAEGMNLRGQRVRANWNCLDHFSR